MQRFVERKIKVRLIFGVNVFRSIDFASHSFTLA